jgi:hypothetical protein
MFSSLPFMKRAAAALAASTSLRAITASQRQSRKPPIAKRRSAPKRTQIILGRKSLPAGRISTLRKVMRAAGAA